MQTVSQFSEAAKVIADIASRIIPEEHKQFTADTMRIGEEFYSEMRIETLVEVREMLTTMFTEYGFGKESFPFFSNAIAEIAKLEEKTEAKTR